MTQGIEIFTKDPSRYNINPVRLSEALSPERLARRAGAHLVFKTKFYESHFLPTIKPNKGFSLAMKKWQDENDLVKPTVQ